MLTCVKCGLAHEVLKAGFVRGRQRYFCKACEYHFTAERPAGPPSRKRHHATIADVARQVGVAPSTVSRALNGHSDISPTTRQAILDAARQLDYQPNLLAQSLKSRATNTIGVVIPDLERPFFATAVSGIQQVATEAGYRVMICQSKESYTTEVSNVQALVASQVDGLLICHSCETENFDHVLPEACRGIPVVHFDRVDESLSSARVMIDDRGGAFAVTEHLLLEGSRTRARGFDCRFSRAKPSALRAAGVNRNDAAIGAALQLRHFHVAQPGFIAELGVVVKNVPFALKL